MTILQLNEFQQKIAIDLSPNQIKQMMDRLTNRGMVLTFLLMGFLLFRTEQWCLQTTLTLSNEATKLDYSADNSYFAITSNPGNKVFIYEPFNYNLQFTYSPPAGKTIQTARFARNSVYLGVGLNDGSVLLISGKAPWSSSAITMFNPTAPATTMVVADIEFDRANTNLLICYTNSLTFYVINNYAGASTTSQKTLTSTTGTGAKGCKFSENNDVVIIDNSGKVYIYPSNLVGLPTTFLSSTGGAYADVDVKNSTATPIKVILGGTTDNRGQYLFNGATQVKLSTTFNSTGPITAVCYSPDGQSYAMGNAADQYMWIFNDTLNSNYEYLFYSTTAIKSCVYSFSGYYLLAGTVASSGSAYVYIYTSQCYRCDVGYYQVGPVGCLACSSAIIACSQCTDSTSCTSCYQGYYINTTTHTCLTCVSAINGCSTCTNGSICIECISGYYLAANNTCVTCGIFTTGCLDCNITSCHVCALEYYLNSTNGCSLCIIPTCQRCSSSVVCLQCAVGYYVVGTGASCGACSINCLSCWSTTTNCTICNRGYYLVGTACTQCSNGCLQCNGTNYCMQCPIGTYINGTGACVYCTAPCATCNSTNSTVSSCLTCTIGYYISSSTCLPCLSNCSICTNSTNCSACNIGYYPAASNTCLVCSGLFTDCSLCTAAACLSCVSGRYLNGSSNCTTCSSVMTGCEACSSSTSCWICGSGFYYTGLAANSSCASCLNNCHTCTNSTTCTSCNIGYYFSTPSCLACSNNCSSCFSLTNCSSCITSFYLNGTTCAMCTALSNCLDCINSTFCTNCAIGYSLSSGNCSQCSSNCLHCNSSACLACNLGSYLSAGVCTFCGFNCSICASTTNCSSCNVGYFLNSSLTSNQCSSCSLVGLCLTCNSSSCLSCINGYYLQSNQCYLCSLSVTNCVDCSQVLVCLSCYQGFYLASVTSCATCSSVLPACLSCSSNSVCTLCISGYYLATNNTCVVCSTKCQTCVTSSTNCLTCSPTYYYNSTTPDCLLCETFLTGCEECLNSTACLSCSSGYYLSASVCSACSSAIPACSLCKNISSCVSCQQGYFLNSSSSCQLCSDVTVGCILCKNSSTCFLCTSGYYLSSGSCLLCVGSIPGCAMCSNISTCLRCESGYYLDATNNCALCQNVLAGCTFCSNISVCLQCEGGFYLSASKCLPCAQPGCQVCVESQPLQCVNCNSGYYLSVNSCLTCPQQGCLQCNSSACLNCDNSYYLTGSSSCALCSSVMTGCGRCSSVGVCLECQSLFYLNTNSCVACSSVMTGCSFCSSAAICLTCDSGFYLNSSSGCTICTSLSGCLLCSNSSFCLSCTSSYYLVSGACLSCSTIVNCFLCQNSTICTACLSGFSLTASGACTAMQVSAGGAPPAQQPSELTFKTYYVNSTVLRHQLTVTADTKFQNTSGVNWNSIVKIYLENVTSSTLLTILSMELGNSDQTLKFYTNNPLSLTTLQMPLMSGGRLLVGQSIDPSVASSVVIPSSTMSQILPAIMMNGDLSLTYSLNDPEFYNSYIESAMNLKLYVFGLVVCILYFVYLFIRAISWPHLDRQGQTIGHLLALKTIPLIIYPTYAEFINFSSGFMVVDMHWLNKLLPTIFSQKIDVSPKGFYFFFTSMNFAGMNLITFSIFIGLLILGYIALKEPQIEALEIKKQKVIPHLKLKAYKEMLFNYFCFGFAFAGFSSIMGAFLNASSVVSLRGMFYIVGIIIYGLVFCEAVSVFVQEKRIGRIRLVFKGTMLAAAAMNPIYLASVAIICDGILIIVQYQMRKMTLQCRKAWCITNVLALLSLMIYFFVPDSLLTLILVMLSVSFILPFQIYMFSCEKNLSPTRSAMNKTVGVEHETGPNFWNLDLKSNRVNKNLNNSTNQINEEKDSIHMKQSFYDELQGKKDARTTGFSTKTLPPIRRNRKFKQQSQQTGTNKLRIQKGGIRKDIDAEEIDDFDGLS